MTTKEYIPFSKREGWEDISPVFQDDGPEDKPVVRIQYSEPFEDTMNYLRAILKKDERSRRAYNLTSEAIKLNPANYTCWHFRRLCIEALEDFDFGEEFKYTKKMVSKNPKNYQLWYHLRWLGEKEETPNRVLDIIDEELDSDSKNYHAWSVRQWVIKHWKLWKEELEYTEKLLQEDFRNNSAWNERAYVITNDPSLRTIEEEIEYAISYINKSPNNLSPWNYIQGLVRNKKFSDYPSIEKFCNEVSEKWKHCANVFSMLVSINEEKNTKESLELAVEYCDKLSNRLDQIHKKYWAYRKQLIEEKLNSM